MRMLVAFLVLLSAVASAAEPTFRTEQLATKLTVGYAVRLLDMNDDKKLDIAIVDSDRILWLQNPDWKENILIQGQTKADNVCFAPADIDGDGKLDFAIGADWRPADTKTGGTMQWIARGKDPAAKWDLNVIGEEPTVHRMQFADLDADGKPELIVAPLFGRGSTKPNFAEAPVRILSYKIPANPRTDRWVPEVINADLHVCHNLFPVDVDKNGSLDLLLVSFEGVHWLERQGSGEWKRTRIGEGDQASSPNKGASEIKLGRLADGSPYIATIEPWHGNKVVVYRPTAPDKLREMWPRTVLDDQLQWGHAVWCANLDDDADEELVIGIRDYMNADNPCGVRIYDPTADGKWTTRRLDPGGVAVEDLACADLDGDGKAEIVAVGRATHNVRIYWNGK